MSQENVEIVRQAFAAYASGGPEGLADFWHPEIEWYPFTAQVEGDEAYHGHEGLRQWWANVDAAFLDCPLGGSARFGYGRVGAAAHPSFVESNWAGRPQPREWTGGVSRGLASSPTGQNLTTLQPSPPRTALDKPVRVFWHAR